MGSKTFGREFYLITKIASSILLKNDVNLPLITSVLKNDIKANVQYQFLIKSMLTKAFYLQKFHCVFVNINKIDVNCLSLIPSFVVVIVPKQMKIITS